MQTKNIIWLAFLILLSKIAVTQDIKGVIYEQKKNKDKSPLPGVNIYWAGTQAGTSSGPDGKFTIKQGDDANNKLVFSFLGYKTDTIDVKEHDPENLLEVTLSLNKTLEEVEIKGVAKGATISRMDPVFTQNLNQDEFKKAACCNLSESFETNASVDVSYSDAVTGAKQIQLLGLAGIYSQIQIENIPNLRGLANTYGLEYIPGSWMESIQISKGTSSVKNGYESITGQINVEYKKPHDSEQLYLNTYVNSMGKMEANFNAAHDVNDNWSTMLLGNIVNMSNEVDHNNDSFLDMPESSQYHFFNRWKYENPGKLHAQIGLQALREDRSGGQLSFNGDQAATEGEAYGININTRRYEAFTKTGILFDRPETSIGIINSLSYHDQDSYFGLNDYEGTQLNYYGNIMYESYLFSDLHNYSVGFSYMYDEYDELLNDSTFTRAESVPGLFAEYTLSLEEKLTLLAGIRSDFHNLYGTLWTPRLHARYAPTENWIFRTSAGKGYRSSNIIAENSHILASSRELVIQEEPRIEETWNFGASLTRYADIWGRQLMVNLDFYRTSFQNQLIVDMDQNIFEANIYNLEGKSFSNSFQVEANYELLPQLEMTAAYRYNDVKMTLNNKLQRKPMVNQYKGLLSLSYTTLNSGWQFDFTTQFNGDARLPDTEQYGEDYQRPELSEAYTIFNAQVSKDIKRWELYVGGENLGNFTQSNPIIASNEPFGDYFDTSLVWGPIVGTKIYFGMRYTIPR